MNGGFPSRQRETILLRQGHARFVARAMLRARFS
jgi:hypothetical protein